MQEKLISEFSETLSVRKSVDGILAFDCNKNVLLRVASRLRDEYEFQVLTDLASIDMGVDAGERRFGAVYHFYSHTKTLIVIDCFCSFNAPLIIILSN